MIYLDIPRIAILSIANLMMCSLLCQSSINSLGNQAKSQEGTIDYSIGQVFYQSYSSSTGKINEGVQQPFEILLVREDQVFDTDYLIQVFPNPVEEKLIVHLEKLSDLSSISFQILDLNGVTQHSDKIAFSKTEVDVKNLPQGVYMIKFFKNTDQIQLFKLIKLN